MEYGKLTQEAKKIVDSTVKELKKLIRTIKYKDILNYIIDQEIEMPEDEYIIIKTWVMKHVREADNYYSHASGEVGERQEDTPWEVVYKQPFFRGLRSILNKMRFYDVGGTMDRPGPIRYNLGGLKEISLDDLMFFNILFGRNELMRDKIHKWVCEEMDKRDLKDCYVVSTSSTPYKRFTIEDAKKLFREVNEGGN